MNQLNEWTSRGRRFLKKTLQEQVIYIEAGMGLGISRLCIIFLPFRWIAPRIGRHMAEFRDAPHPGDIPSIRLIGRAVNTMSRLLPWECKCLAQALTAKAMLNRRNIGSTLCLGVAKSEDRSIKAHAWVKTGSIVVTGEAGMSSYTIVSTFS